MSSTSRPPNASMDLAPNHPSQAEEVIPPYESNVEFKALDEALRLPERESEGDFSDLILGGGAFGYGVYTDRENVQSAEPLRIVRAALEAGINGIDTSPHYHPSEILLGHALSSLSSSFPRESYKLLTKAGKYGPRLQDHVYEPSVIRASVERSLRRLQTTYLDVVYLHDVEFLSSAPFPVPAGDHVEALSDPAVAAQFALEEPYEPKGDGDRAVLSSFLELRKLQAEGKIRACGLAGYPLPTLLRYCRMIKEQTGEPVDVVQSYSHYTLQNDALSAYLPEFQAAGVKHVMNAAPLSMGLLTTRGPPDWHPGNFIDKLRDSARKAAELCEREGGSIEQEGLSFGYKRLMMGGGEPGERERTVPCVIGCTTLDQLEQTLRSFKQVRERQDQEGGDGDESELGRKVRDMFERDGVLGLSWQKPAPEEMI